MKKYNEEFTFANKLREDLLKKQGNYIKREQDYRNTIDKLKKQIDDMSKKPLGIAPKTQDDELELDGGFKLEINKNLHQHNTGPKPGVHQDTKAVEKIAQNQAEIIQQIGLMQEKAQ